MYIRKVMSDDEAPEDWDFYVCLVDDAQASISLNLGFEHTAPVAGTDTLYWIRIQMLDAAEHGSGSATEAEILYPVEDHITGRAQTNGFLYVGRLRNNGCWQLTFYGPANRLEALQSLANGLGGREVEAGSKPDPSWTYYREFLFPSAERRQWMQDRRVVEVLAKEGDALRLPRRVDHWIDFPTANARDAFVGDAAREGFEVEEAIDDVRFGARVHRVDSVELEHIHQVVMTLLKLAEPHAGDYDGWETSVAQAPS